MTDRQTGIITHTHTHTHTCRNIDKNTKINKNTTQESLQTV